MSRLFILALALLLPLENARSMGIPLVLTDYPGQLQACISSNDCLLDTVPSTIIGNMEAYQFTDDLQGTPVPGYALRYSLLSPSGENSTFSGSTAYTGHIWLTVQNTYDLAGDSNFVTVYTDQVIPQPVNQLFGDSNGLDITVDMTNTALLASAGSELIGIDFEDNLFHIADMNLLSDTGGGALLPCAAADCSASAQLNLIYLSFIDSGIGTSALQFNASDARSLLYQVINEYDVPPEQGGGTTSQSYYVAAVPLPAAFWLFASGLVLLGSRFQRIKD